VPEGGALSIMIKKLVLLLKIELNKDDFAPPPGWRWDGDWYISPELR
jgi:hypothetical protein